MMDGICPLWHSKVFSHNQVGLLEVGNHRDFRKNYFEVQRRSHARFARVANHTRAFFVRLCQMIQPNFE